jgi:diguanylate cyclase (GGDEF)-like protein
VLRARQPRHLLGVQLLRLDERLQLQHALARARAPVGFAAVLFIDLDRFKVVNDSLGHATGDHLLVEVARRLSGAVRSTDMVARWGGEEFVVLLRDCALDDAVERAEEIRRQIAGRTFPGVGMVTVSVGAAQLTGADDATSLLGRADEALYEAKRAGRNKVVAGGRR